MFSKHKKKSGSFLEKLTGVSHDELPEYVPAKKPYAAHEKQSAPVKIETEEPAEELDGELPVDVYETPSDILIHTMVAGVRPDDLNISITPETVTISGRREYSREYTEENFLFRELYWGSFSRTINLPKEIDPDLAQAIEKHGLLAIKLPKIDKGKTHRLKVRSE